MKTALTASSISASDDIRLLLRERLRAAKRRNHRFSLRSFAKQLGIDHSTLSQVLRKKRGFSEKDLRAVAKALGLSESAIQAHHDSFGKQTKAKKATQRLRSLQFDLDTFQLLSSWHHYALLELTHVQGFKTDVRWIAKALGIEPDEVNTCLQRLLRLGLLEMSQRQRWIDKSGDSEFHTAALPQAVSNQVQREIHELAIEAIERSPCERRVQQHMVMAFDTKTLPRMQRLVDQFMGKIRALAAENGERDEVYELAVSFFPVSAVKTRGENNG